MSTPRRTTIAALAGGVALASAGFAVGSQSGDGSADARDRDRDRGGVSVARAPAFGPPGRGPHRRGLGDLAERLGVSDAKLHAALRSLGGPGDRHADIEAAVAQELGISADRLREAFEKAHEAAHDAFARRLAEKLGIDADKVKDALPRPPGP